MKTYLQWLRSVIDLETRSIGYIGGFGEGSIAAWEYRTNSFKIQQRVVNDLRKELNRALSKGARSVRACQLQRRDAERLQRENRNLITQLRIARDELSHC